MSVRVIAMVFEAGPEDLAQHSVMMALADNADDSGIAWPGHELLARKSRMSVRNAIRVLDALERDGWLVKRKRRHGEHRRGNVYEMNLARLRPAEAPRETSDTRSRQATKNAAKTDACIPRRDSMSRQQRLPDGEVTNAHREVTSSASRSDMTLADVLLDQLHAPQNRQEPSLEPSSTPVAPASGGDGERIAGELAKATNGHRRAAQILMESAKVLRLLGISDERKRMRLQDAIGDALEMHCDRENCTPAQAGELAVANVKLYLEHRSMLRIVWGWSNFFREGYWRDSGAWLFDQAKLRQLEMRKKARIGVHTG